MTDLAENMAREIAERLNGGEFKDGKWYTDGQRTAWINAVRPFADEIEKLRDEVYFLKDDNALLIAMLPPGYKYEVFRIGTKRR